MTSRTYDENDCCVSCGALQGNDHDPDCILGLFEHATIATSYESCRYNDDGPNYYVDRETNERDATPEGAEKLGIELARVLNPRDPVNPHHEEHCQLDPRGTKVTLKMEAPTYLVKACMEAFTQAGGHMGRFRDLEAQEEKARIVLHNCETSARDFAKRFQAEKHLLNEAGIQGRLAYQEQHDQKVRDAKAKLDATREALEAFKRETGLWL